MGTPKAAEFLTPSAGKSLAQPVYDGGAGANGLYYQSAVNKAVTLAQPWMAATARVDATQAVRRGGALALVADRGVRAMGFVAAGPWAAAFEDAVQSVLIESMDRLAWKLPPLKKHAQFRFSAFFHPFVCQFVTGLRQRGIPGLLNLDNQLLVDNLIFSKYVPSSLVTKPYPQHKVDFGVEDGAATGAVSPYAVYNWELFFHAPLLIAARLSSNQRFEDAMKWFHYVFDPTSDSPAAPPARYWKVLPLQTAEQLRVDKLLERLNAGDTSLVAQWEALKKDPFKPHLIARMRLSAYQKSVVMKYIDNLIAWGDQLFRRDTIEWINQAAQLYVLAADILGPRPQPVPPRGTLAPRTYAELKPHLDKFSDARLAFENDLPYASAVNDVDPASPEVAALLGAGTTLYFCAPQNDKLLGYWDTVADRLFKIRNCMNIEGIVRQLALFEPPIDPAVLVQAAARGVDLNSVLNDQSAPLPPNRFTFVIQKALEMCAEVRSLGSQLLSGLEKRDSEGLALLHAAQDIQMLEVQVKRVREQQIEETRRNTEGLQESLKALESVRIPYFMQKLGLSTRPAAGSLVPPSVVLSASEQELGDKTVQRTSSTRRRGPTRCWPRKPR